MSSVDGLISGLGTTDLIRQLMQLERQPVVRLQSRKTTADKSITALQGLNTKFQALAELAKKFSTAAGSWTSGGVTSSNPALLTASAAPGTAATSLTVTVKSLAATHRVASTTMHAGTDAVADNRAPITISYLDTNGAATSMVVTEHDGTVNSIISAVNARSTSPVTAQLVDGRLEFTSKRTGEFSAFDVSGINRKHPQNGTIQSQVTFDVATQAADAEVQVGSGDFATTVKSQSNLVEVAKGVTVALKAADAGAAVTITVTEASKPADDVQKLVDAANEILKEIKTLTAYDSETKKKGLLQGDGMLRGLANDVLRSVYEAVGEDSAGSAGLQLTRDGLLQFDKAKFDTAYAEDPTRVTALFTRDDGLQGVAQRLTAVAETATKFGVGHIAQAIESRRNDIKRIDDSIATWDARLSLKEARLRRQFAALETMLGAAQQQGNWLAGQIASLPRMSSD
jgi:flagellar hook-associated protein 2